MIMLVGLYISIAAFLVFLALELVNLIFVLRGGVEVFRKFAASDGEIDLGQVADNTGVRKLVRRFGSHFVLLALSSVSFLFIIGFGIALIVRASTAQ
jgi:hypothetical protein